MPYPTVTTLPAAPSRIGDPDNFLTESDVYMSALPTYRTQINAFDSYTSSLNISTNNWGVITGSNPDSVSLTPASSLPNFGADGATITLGIDTLFANLQTFSSKVNATGTFFDSAAALLGTTFVDPLRPTVGTISSLPPARSDTQSVFESKAVNFFSEVSARSVELKNLYDYIYNNAFASDNYGALAETITFSDNFGTIE